MRHTTTTILGIVATAALLTACSPNSSSPSTTPTTTSAPAATTAAPQSAPAASQAIPNLVGQGLQAAQDAAQAAGFYNLASHDATGSGRHQILDRDWQVCSQTPAAGTSAPADTRLDFGAVKTTETCP